MFFKYIYILFLINMVFSQSYFNRIQPEEIYLGDARSMSIGTISFTSNNSGLIINNPAHMSFVKNRINVDFDFELDVLSERRSNQFKDFFGSYIGQSDYVFNQTTSSRYSFSLILNTGSNSNKEKPWEFTENLSIGLSYKPFSSFKYKYEEELRGGWANDNELGIKDPIIGYHIFNTSGELYLQSIGFSYKVRKEDRKLKSIGFSFNQILPTEIKDEIDIIEIYDECISEFEPPCDEPYISSEDVLASMESFENTYNFNNTRGLFGLLNEDTFFSIGINTKLMHQMFLSLSYESSVKLFSENQDEINYPNISDMVGLPQYIEFNDQNELEYLISGLKYYKPRITRIGISYYPKSMTNLLLAFEIENKYWKVKRNGMDNNI